MPRKFSKSYTRKKYGGKKPTKLATKKYVKAQFKKELEQKWENFERNDSILNTGLAIDLSGSITQGTDIDKRIGNKIQPTSLAFDITFQIADSSNRFRFIVFQWHPNDATDVPQVDELLLYSDIGYVTQAPLNPIYRGQYTLLADKFIMLAGLAPQQRHFRWKMRPKKTVTYNYGSNSGTNHIYYIAVSDSNVSPHPQYTLTALLKYTDA